MWEVFFIAVVAAFWPALIAVALVALASSRPVTLLSSFLLGGLITTSALGFAIAFSLSGSSLVTGSHPPAPPAVDITVGALALVFAVVASRRDPAHDPAAERRHVKENPGRPWTERMLSRGTGRIAFLVGMLINLVPGFFAVVGYTKIAELGYGTTGTIVLVVAFNVIMFALIEVPLVGYLVVPRSTEESVTRLNTWLRQNGRRAVVVASAGFGVYLLVRGILALIV